MFIDPIRSMVLSKSKPWNMLLWKWSRGHAIDLDFAMGAPDVVAAAMRKPAVPQAGSQISSLGVGAVIATISGDDVPWRAELAVLSSGRDLAEHVLVDVALGVAALHRQFVEHVYDLVEQAWDRESRIAHVMRVGRLLAAKLA